MSHRKEFLLREKKKNQKEKEKQNKQTNKQTNKTQGTGGVAQIVDT
jgi:hypothetical protein